MKLKTNFTKIKTIKKQVSKKILKKLLSFNFEKYNMKIFNEIESDYSGEIVDILVNDGDPIEYDQVLFALKSE